MSAVHIKKKRDRLWDMNQFVHLYAQTPSRKSLDELDAASDGRRIGLHGIVSREDGADKIMLSSGQFVDRWR